MPSVSTPDPVPSPSPSRQRARLASPQKVSASPAGRVCHALRGGCPAHPSTRPFVPRSLAFRPRPDGSQPVSRATPVARLQAHISHRKLKEEGKIENGTGTDLGEFFQGRKDVIIKLQARMLTLGKNGDNIPVLIEKLEKWLVSIPKEDAALQKDDWRQIEENLLKPGLAISAKLLIVSCVEDMKLEIQKAEPRWMPKLSERNSEIVVSLSTTICQIQQGAKLGELTDMVYETHEMASATMEMASATMRATQFLAAGVRMKENRQKIDCFLGSVSLIDRELANMVAKRIVKKDLNLEEVMYIYNEEAEQRRNDLRKASQGWNANLIPTLGAYFLSEVTIENLSNELLSQFVFIKKAGWAGDKYHAFRAVEKGRDEKGLYLVVFDENFTARDLSVGRKIYAKELTAAGEKIIALGDTRDEEAITSKGGRKLTEAELKEAAKKIKAIEGEGISEAGNTNGNDNSNGNDTNAGKDSNDGNGNQGGASGAKGTTGNGTTGTGKNSGAGAAAGIGASSSIGVNAIPQLNITGNIIFGTKVHPYGDVNLVNPLTTGPPLTTSISFFANNFLTASLETPLYSPVTVLILTYGVFTIKHMLEDKIYLLHTSVTPKTAVRTASSPISDIHTRINDFISEHRSELLKATEGLRKGEDVVKYNAAIENRINSLNARGVLERLGRLDVAPTPFIEESRNDELAIQALLTGKLVIQMPFAGAGSRMEKSLEKLGVRLPKDQLRLANINIWKIAKTIADKIGLIGAFKLPEYAINAGLSERGLLALEQGILDLKKTHSLTDRQIQQIFENMKLVVSVSDEIKDNAHKVFLDPSRLTGNQFFSFNKENIIFVTGGYGPGFVFNDQGQLVANDAKMSWSHGFAFRELFSIKSPEAYTLTGEMTSEGPLTTGLDTAVFNYVRERGAEYGCIHRINDLILLHPETALDVLMFGSFLNLRDKEPDSNNKINVYLEMMANPTGQKGGIALSQDGKHLILLEGLNTKDARIDQHLTNLTQEKLQATAGKMGIPYNRLYGYFVITDVEAALARQELPLSIKHSNGVISPEIPTGDITWVEGIRAAAALRAYDLFIEKGIVLNEQRDANNNTIYDENTREPKIAYESGQGAIIHDCKEAKNIKDGLAVVEYLDNPVNGVFQQRYYAAVENKQSVRYAVSSPVSGQANEEAPRGKASLSSFLARLLNYPVLKPTEIQRQETLARMDNLLKEIKLPVTIVFDIDDTLIGPDGEPKVEGFAELVKVLRQNGHLVGIVTDRTATIDNGVQIGDSKIEDNELVTIVSNTHEFSRLQNEDFVKLGVTVNDFDFFAMALFSFSDNKLYRYLRVQNRFAKEPAVLNRLVTVDNNHKAAKLAALAFVDNLFRAEWNLDLFKESYLVMIGDNLYIDHALVQLRPVIPTHKEKMKATKQALRQMGADKLFNRGKCSIIVPVVGKEQAGESTFSFVGGAEIKLKPVSNISGESLLRFGIREALVSILEDIKHNIAINRSIRRVTVAPAIESKREQKGTASSPVDGNATLNALPEVIRPAMVRFALASDSTGTSRMAYVSVSSIKYYSKDRLSKPRIIKIMENFDNATQKPHYSDPVQLIWLSGERACAVFTDGNHRVFAARLLGRETIYAQVFIANHQVTNAVSSPVQTQGVKHVGAIAKTLLVISVLFTTLMPLAPKPLSAQELKPRQATVIVQDSQFLKQYDPIIAEGLKIIKQADPKLYEHIKANNIPIIFEQMPEKQYGASGAKAYLLGGGSIIYINETLKGNLAYTTLTLAHEATHTVQFGRWHNLPVLGYIIESNIPLFNIGGMFEYEKQACDASKEVGKYFKNVPEYFYKLPSTAQTAYEYREMENKWRALFLDLTIVLIISLLGYGIKKLLNPGSPRQRMTPRPSYRNSEPLSFSDASESIPTNTSYTAPHRRQLTTGAKLTC